ncbi:4-hydroxy-tetrahydrodipicolinate synthase [Winogradskya consettensis]|uniref:4-hydroxy-tetrahydrodipicolinate synthase n=1 Tax=Winogradskya consettensis TaxID=113560 RepID=A0A919VLL1_9ACTN|nr:dihydrodipicolinate synthase family protein [Actinoplanes consettensis]GIM70719.1 4-hydroxy-tetrahydrodipicolinate synthase [Actinoplanes consettensis]
MTFAGVYVPLITPFDASGAVAFDALERLAHDVLDGGAAGLVALGTTGEPGSLDDKERDGVLDVIAGVCRARRAQLIVGANRIGDAAGVPSHAVAVLTLVPPFLLPGEDGVVAYFEDFAARSPVPVLAYHVPYRTGQALSAAALRRIAAIDGVAGMKLAAGGIDTTVVDLLSDPPADLAILCGDDAFLAPLLSMGVPGAIIASAHLDTAAFTALVHDREPQPRLARLALALFAEPNPTVIKAVLHARGRIPTPDVRLPLLPASAASLHLALSV